MVFNLKKEITYLGIDEHSPTILRGGFLVVVTETKNENLAIESQIELKKAKDYLREANNYTNDKRIKNYKNMPTLPTIEEFKKQGLSNFYWTRASNGRFSRQLVEHASIAHVVASNGYNPNSTVIMIDAFFGKNDMSVYLIQEYLNARNFKIPRENIIMVGNGDRTIPLINFADIIAFQIGLDLNKRYQKYHKRLFGFEIKPHEVDYDLQRVVEPIGDKGRNDLEKAIQSWRYHKS